MAGKHPSEMNPSFTRRQFLKSGTAFAFPFLSGCGLDSLYGRDLAEIPKIDITPTLKRNQSLYPADAKKPSVVVFNGKRQDFQGHLDRPFGSTGSEGASGVDYIAGKSTITVASDRGYISDVIDKERHSDGVNEMIIMHGFGYRTNYGGMATIDSRLDSLEERGRNIGKGVGPVIGHYPHIHSGLFGPNYSPLLFGVDIQEFDNPLLSLRYPLDSELFAPCQDGLPFIIPGIDLGESLISRQKREQPKIFSLLEEAVDKQKLDEREREQYESLFNNTKFADWYIKNKGFDPYIDRKIGFLYVQCAKRNPIIKNADKTGEYLTRLMRENLPILTSPVAKE